MPCRIACLAIAVATALRPGGRGRKATGRQVSIMGHSGSVQVCNPNRTEDVPHDLPIRESSPGGSYGTVPLRRTSELSRSRSGFLIRCRSQWSSTPFTTMTSRSRSALRHGSRIAGRPNCHFHQRSQRWPQRSTPGRARPSCGLASGVPEPTSDSPYPAAIGSCHRSRRRVHRQRWWSLLLTIHRTGVLQRSGSSLARDR
jgi:hypothetical protein